MRECGRWAGLKNKTLYNMKFKFFLILLFAFSFSVYSQNDFVGEWDFVSQEQSGGEYTKQVFSLELKNDKTGIIRFSFLPGKDWSDPDCKCSISTTWNLSWGTSQTNQIKLNISKGKGGVTCTNTNLCQNSLWKKVFLGVDSTFKSYYDNKIYYLSYSDASKNNAKMSDSATDIQGGDPLIRKKPISVSNQTNNSILGWWKIKAYQPVMVGYTTLQMPLWGYIGFMDDKTGETWECGHNGQNCVPGTLDKFTWTETSGQFTWKNTQGYTGTTKITWIDDNTFTTLDSKGQYLKTYYRAVNAEDAKCLWHMRIWNDNCNHLPTSCDNPPPPPRKIYPPGCGSCQYGCRDCYTCSGTGRVWDSQVGKWYPCTAYGCGVFAPKGKICK
jgi:hypothetical protein